LVCKAPGSLRFQSILKTPNIFAGFRGIQKKPMPKRSATRKVTRGILCAASVLIFPALSLSSMAQGPTNQQSTGRAPAAATIDGATAAAIAAEGELKATIRTFQSDNPSAVYRYYWWHDNCYVRYQSGDYQLVASDYCQH
jgi:hypothetical protein